MPPPHSHQVAENDIWPGIEHAPIQLPVVPIDVHSINRLHPVPRLLEWSVDPVELTVIGLYATRREIANAFRTLDERTRLMLIERFGLGEDSNPKTLEQVGERFNLTRESIRRIEARALSTLRHPPSKDLRDLLFTDLRGLEEPDMQTVAELASLAPRRDATPRERGFEYKSPQQIDIEQSQSVIEQRDRYFRNLKK